MQPQPPSPGWGQSEQQPYPQYPQPQMYQQSPQTQYPPQQPMYPMAGQQLPMTPLPQPQKKRRSRRNLIIGVIVAIVVIGIIAANAGKGSTATNTNQSTPTAQTTTQATSQPTNAPTQTAATPTPAPTQKPAPTFLTFGDGTYQVGKDIKPGTYRTRTGSPNCYYARLKGFSGSLNDVLANNNTDNPAIVTILPGDKGFTSENCGTWTSDLSQIITSKTTFSDGMYIVGVDLAPGTYKNTPSQNCYYARLSNFTGGIDSILANNNTDNAAIVMISASDKGFESTNCGTWTKI